MKKLLKSDSICESYAQMKNGPVFLTHSVVIRLSGDKFWYNQYCKYLWKADLPGTGSRSGVLCNYDEAT